MKQRTTRELEKIAAYYLGLSPRESQVYALTVTGTLCRDIAAKLGIARNTVFRTRHVIAEKLEVLAYGQAPDVGGESQQVCSACGGAI